MSEELTLYHPNLQLSFVSSNMPSDLSKDIQDDMEYIKLFLENKKEGSLNTVRVYATEIKYFLDFINFPQVNLKDVTVKMCIQYRDSLNGYADSTKSRKLHTLSSLFKFGVEIGYLKYNPLKAVRKPKVPITSQERYLTPKEADELLTELKKKPRNYLIGIILFTTGLRASELVNIKWSDFYEDTNGNIGLRVIGKGKKPRNVKIRRDVWSYILPFRANQGKGILLDTTDDSYLILNRDGGPLSDRYCREMLKRAAKRVGIKKDISTHWLRHTSASLAINGGADIKKCLDQYGWEDVKTAQRYIHSVNQLEDAAADYVDIKV